MAIIVSDYEQNKNKKRIENSQQLSVVQKRRIFIKQNLIKGPKGWKIFYSRGGRLCVSDKSYFYDKKKGFEKIFKK